MRNLIVFTISMVFALSVFGQTFDSATEGASGSDLTSQRTATGYEYYDASGNLTGHSEEAVDGGYIYYDSSGAEVGTIEGDAESGYSLTDVLGGDVGEIETTPSGKYRFRSETDGDLTEVDVIGGSGEDIGVINPEALSQ
jgi:hypothetical protein